ncbi:MAG: TonB-dependent receptor [Halioglobus sp.]
MPTKTESGAMTSQSHLISPRKKLCAAILSTVLAPLAVSPLAQAQENESRVLEEITVTARQRTENLQGVPVAVTVMDESMIQKTFAQNLGEMGAYAPNVTIGTVPGFNAASIAIRGVSTGDIPSTFDPAVTVAVDGFYLGHYQASLLDMFDIQQVEILRGPQGTLFGKNTIGGVINVTTKRPSGEFGVQAKARVGNEGRQDIMAGIDFPIVDDVLAARIAVQQFNFDGFYENTYDGSDAGGQDLFAARAKLLWTPTDTFEALLSFEYIEDDSDTPMVVNTTTDDKAFYFGAGAPYPAYPGRGSGGPANLPLGDPFKTGLVPPENHTPGFAESKNTDGHQEDVDGIYLTLNWDLMGGTLTSISGYRGVDSDYYNDYVGEPAAIYATIRSIYRDTYSQEIRFAGNTDNLDYVVGGYYQQNDMDYENYTSLGPDHPFAGLAPVIPVGGGLTDADGSQEATSYAIFGEGSYAISDAMSFTAGIRYSDEEKDFELSPLFFPTEARVERSDSWDDITYRLGVDYQMSDETMIYASFSTGFKSGGFNEQAGTLVSAATGFDPEEAESFEVGMKSDFLDNTLRLNIAAFYVEYTDLQVDSVVPIPGVGQESIVTNAGEVTSYGIEADLMWLATDNLTIDGTLGLLDAEYDEFDCNRSGVPGSPDEDCTDFDVKRTPDATGSLGATYSFGLSKGGAMDLNVNATYTDSFYNDIINSDSSEHEEVTLLNASVSYFSANEKFRLALFGRNLTDEEYQTSGLSVANLWNFSTYGNPLTYGVELEFNF